MDIRPQPGPQEKALACPADILLYGGAAFGGKTFALLLDPLHYVDVPGFTACIFRRNATMVRVQGGLWDESSKLYPKLGATPREMLLEWRFPSTATIKFAHLEHEKTKHDYQGAQFGFVGFDELTHFSEGQFWYLLSRARSSTGVKPYVRATCNPDKDSWVRKLIDWWIGKDGYPVPERCGVLRYFVRDGEAVVWGDSVEEVADKVPHLWSEDLQPEDAVKSITFIPAKATDNQIGVKSDPGYVGWLQQQDRVNRERLLGGNWDIRYEAGEVFQRPWFHVVDTKPVGRRVRRVRYWDFAATESKAGTDPDYTVGVKMAEHDGEYWVEDVVRFRCRPKETEDRVRATAEQDGLDVDVWWEQEEGASGPHATQYWSAVLKGFTARGDRVRGRGDKVTRARPMSSAAENGRVSLLRAPWNDAFLSELEQFPTGGHKDQVDAASGAFAKLSGVHRRAGNFGAVGDLKTGASMWEV